MFLRTSRRPGFSQVSEARAQNASAQPQLARPPLGNQSLQRLLRSGAIQASLTVNEPGDRFEQEADRVADSVMRSPKPAVPEVTPLTAYGLQRRCAECAAEEEEKGVQRSPSSLVAPAAAPRQVERVLGSSGRPLEAGVRDDLESRFGRDFSRVRVHTDAPASESAQQIQAKAYTAGDHIVFGAGQYAPAKPEGKRLLAHELTHVLQQSQDGETRLQREEDDEPVDEQELAENEENEEEDNDEDKADEDQVMSPDLLASPPQPRAKKKKKKQDKTKSKTKPKAKPKPKEKETPVQPSAEEATEPSPGAVKAIEHAKKLHDQTSPAIWFDSWGNDLRDNDLDGKVDGSSEQKLSDGVHYGKTMDAMVCKDSSDSTDSCPAADQSKVKVNYKVCIDIPIESYKAAGLTIPTTRWIPTFFGSLKSNKDWTVWKAPAAPKSFLPGDIVAAANAQHQHAGIIEGGFLGSNVINIPGPSAARKFKVFKPSGLNDMVSVPAVLFDAFLSIDWVARPKK